MRTIINRADNFDDSSSKNSWRWEWTEFVCPGGERIGKFIRKQVYPGMAFCSLCNSDINYNKRGRVSLEDHIARKKHQKEKSALKSTSTITGNAKKKEPVYGAPLMFAEKEDEDPLPVSVPIGDRISNSEAMVLGFVAENSLSLSMVPKLLELVKVLSKDKLVVDRMKLDNCTASYKLKYGLSQTLLEELLCELRVTPFALNLDEATNSNHEKYVTVLVSHFSEKQQKTVVNHLYTFKVDRCTSAILYKELEEMMGKFELPWKNLLALLMDSCAVMRGKTSGLETLVRSRKAKHLLDIDGDSCHHVHNSAKNFCKQFENHCEKLMSDIHTDFKWSSYNRSLFDDLCVTVGVKPSTPKEFVSHRWLSLLEVCCDTVRLFDALTLFYFAYLQKEDRYIHEEVEVEILNRHSLNPETCESIKKIQDDIKKTIKAATKEGKERKSRIIEKMFVKREKTLLVLHFYCSVLPIFQQYVTYFQNSETKVHELHNRQEDLLREYLGFFLKSEMLQGGANNLLKIDLDHGDSHLPTASYFCGEYVKRELSRKRKSDSLKVEFMAQVRKAYVAGGRVLQEKLPLNNPVLKTFSCLDPSLRSSTPALIQLLKLPKFFKHLLVEKEVEDFDQEARRYASDNSLPANDPLESIDTWWAKVSVKKYPVLTRLVKASLSCFHGPLVESSFSGMSEIIDKSNTCIDVGTYSATQTVSYALKTAGKSAVQYFQKEKTEPVDSKLVQNMRSAWKKNKDRLAQKKAGEIEKFENLGVAHKKMPAKRHSYEELLQEAKRAKYQHLSEDGIDDRSTKYMGEKISSRNATSDKPSSCDQSTTSDSTSSSAKPHDEKCKNNTQMKQKQSTLNSFFKVQKTDEGQKKSSDESVKFPKSLYKSLDDVLSEESRMVERIVGDGNCFFRAISKAVDGCQSNHAKWRKLICDTVCNNRNLFEKFVDVPFHQHTTAMRELKTWATTCEIYGAAKILGLPIYMFSAPSDSANIASMYKWIIFQPSLSTVNQPDKSDGQYITLCNTQANHFDRVVPIKSNCSLPPPVLEGFDTHHSID